MRSIHVRAAALLSGTASAQVSPPAPAAVDVAKAFLVRTQREGGSWPMTSRPVRPGGAGSKRLVPITGAGSAWAVLGLVPSRGTPRSGDRADRP